MCAQSLIDSDDFPKSLGLNEQQIKRCELLFSDHIQALTEFVHTLRGQKGEDYSIPYFDPYDGGRLAQVLFLLEAAGPKAVKSGFISRSNPDETAKNFYLLNYEAGIKRELSVLWNIVPWYIGTGQKIRPANKHDIAEGCESLGDLIKLLSNLKVIVLVGKKSQSSRQHIQRLVPTIEIVEMPHPSPMFVNRHPNNRKEILAILKQLKLCL